MADISKIKLPNISEPLDVKDETARNTANAKEDKGKITIGGTQYTASKHTVTIVTDGVTTTFDMVGVS